MQSHHRVFSDILYKFINSQQILNTYAEKIYKNLIYLPGHELENNQNTIILNLIISEEFCNFHKNAHGGALATIIDCTTTLALLKINQNKTTSIDLSTQYLNPVNLGEKIFIRAECLKFGRSICYSEADIFDKNFKRLVTGRHIKAVVPGLFI